MEFLLHNNDLENWMMAIGVCIGATATMHFLRMIALRRLGDLSRRTVTRLDDLVVKMLRRTFVTPQLAIGLYLGSIFLVMPESWRMVVSRIAVAGLVLQLGIWGDTALRGWRSQLLATPGDGARKASSTILFFMMRLVVWTVAFLMMLDNFGFNITTLVASLGIGGIAVALATQNILGDLFASLSIMLDKPFEIGDFIIVGDALGAVEYIGLKTTRLRGLGGEQIVFSNGELLRSRIHNHKRMASRRVAFVLRVAYGTSEAQVTAIPAMIREIIKGRSDVDFERAHFFRYGDWSLDFEVVYHFKSPDYILHMDAQQDILLHIYRAFQREGIQFAHPLSVVRVADHRDPAGGWPPADAAGPVLKH
ncbi:mechanosensitive ion channel family protein [Massilia sp. 9I]|uniref:mechanosensitive ion channel family protein n=1 Tax=Massilia sp. 9I TaxID=2653152 RepID=UPI0012F2BC0A|nr:mechanosensitive ion channel family protein [Massilia sp. 9I]VXB76592.1 Potassium efflux system KefA protein / Small-conductance mechanosensitive channel [Massilia sp. 9I]